METMKPYFMIYGTAYIGVEAEARAQFEAEVEGTDDPPIDANFAIYCSNNLEQYADLYQHHTSGKVRVSEDGCDMETDDDAALGICTMYATEKVDANAAFMVKAWNNFDSMFKALKQIQNNFELNKKHNQPVSLQEIEAGLNIISLAIKAAE